jgi:putative restriction endonuclease
MKQALEAAHIVPWTDARIDQRIAPTNGLLLCATHHSLFDAQILTVTTDCKVACSLQDQKSEKWTDADRRLAIALEGVDVSLPRDPRLHPSQEALKHRANRQ